MAKPVESVYITPEKLRESFKGFGKNAAVTEGRFEIVAPCSVADLDWNHMDQLHRPWLHRTYGDALRLVRTPDMALSLTKVGRFGALVLVTDVRLAPGLFYQSYTLFSLIYVHTLIKMTPKGDKTLQTVDWFIVSHPWLKFLHGNLSKRFLDLNIVQNDEDAVVRSTRKELRDKGYCFASDDPDFLNSNTVTQNTRFPKLETEARLELSGMKKGETRKADAGPIGLLIRKDEAGYTVWSQVCPHEGGPLEESRICGNKIQCPWHGLNFGGAVLTPAQPTGRLNDLELSLSGEAILARPRAGIAAAAR